MSDSISTASHFSALASELLHYGTKRHSGRYPYGSGGDDAADPRTFLGYVDKLKKSGMSDKDIYEHLNINSNQLRQLKQIAKNEVKQADIAMAQRLREKGLSNVAIGDRMGINESSVRALLTQSTKDKADILGATKNKIKEAIEGKTYVDVGAGVHQSLSISKDKLDTAVAALRLEGYKLHYVQIPQGSSGKFTTVKVLTKGDVTYSEVFKNRAQIQQIEGFSEDGGRSFFGILPPLSVRPSRLGIRYAEDGGGDSDGVIWVRPGVPSVSLGGNNYAQVRVLVGDGHFAKGMAHYKDDLPPGVDLVFNTNKSNTGNKLDALKPLVKNKVTGEVDPDNPFGAVISRQISVKDSQGREKVTSAMNLVNEEGTWGKWSKSLSSQMLSKQSPVLAKEQLNMTFERRRQELDEIMSLTNPTVRKKLLDSYADDVDAAAVHLKAAALPRQASHVILPVASMKDTEVYAPNYKHGEPVVLIRYPHGGTFEIPELKVNNRHPEARALLGNAPDAIGINPAVAKRLSGADFDGDTVLVIPNSSGRVKSTPALKKLQDFDPIAAYPAYEGMPKLSSDRKQQLMGDVSNLITDMTIKGATPTELAQAVRHSMVVIDAEKHNLNYKLSAEANGISALKKKYQAKPDGRAGGAATIVSRKKSYERIPEIAPRRASDGGPVDPVTGKKVFVPTGRNYKDANGNTVFNTTKISKLGTADDAHTLSSGTPIEKVYADHSNRLKDLANQARRESVRTPSINVNPSAKTAYAGQVVTLNHKLEEALKNRPLERQARILADGVVADKRRAYPDMDGTQLKKVQAQAIAEARLRTGARKKLVEITDDEWTAIQAGAISNHRLIQILNNSDLDTIKKLATPRTPTVMTSAKQLRARSMLAAGYTQGEIAEALGVAVSTLRSSLEGGE